MKFWFLPLLVFVLSACGRPQNDLANTSWLLQNYGMKNALQNVLQNAPVTLEIDETGRKAGGSGSCNSYGSDLTIRGSTLSIKNIVSTAMACLEPSITAQETNYFDLLRRVTAFEKTDTTLRMIAGEERLEFVSK